MDHQLEEILTATGRAPSVYNTQPWRLRVRSDTEFDIVADYSRRLVVIDPNGRQLLVSCGAAVEYARVFARAHGLEAQVETRDAVGPERPLVAEIAIKAGPAPSRLEETLGAAIATRSSHRGAFDPTEVPSGLLDELRRAAESTGAYLALASSREDMITAAMLINDADQQQRDNPSYLAELADWAHRDPQLGDGFTSQAISDSQRIGSQIPLRSLDPTGQVPEGDLPPMPDSASLAVVCTDGDATADWVIAGRALALCLLDAERLGLRASMLTQMLDRTVDRATFRRALRLGGWPQIGLRLGYGRPTGPTPRRPVSDLIDQMQGA